MTSAAPQRRLGGRGAVSETCESCGHRKPCRYDHGRGFCAKWRYREQPPAPPRDGDGRRKRCAVCGVTRRFSAFRDDAHYRDGKSRVCIACEAERGEAF